VKLRVGISQINRRWNASKEKSLNSLNTALNDVAKQVAGRAGPLSFILRRVTPEHFPSWWEWVSAQRKTTSLSFLLRDERSIIRIYWKRVEKTRFNMGIYCCYISPRRMMWPSFPSITSNYSLVCAERFRFSTSVCACVICFIENEKFLVSLIYDSLMSALPSREKREKSLPAREKILSLSRWFIGAFWCALRAEYHANEPTSECFSCLHCVQQPVGLSSSYLLY
jgi:hypothetical protein